MVPETTNVGLAVFDLTTRRTPKTSAMIDMTMIVFVRAVIA